MPAPKKSHAKKSAAKEATPKRGSKPKDVAKKRAMATRQPTHAPSPKDIVTVPIVSAAALSAANPMVGAYVALFGTLGVALSLVNTLVLDAMRPAAQAYGTRLAMRVAPSAADDEEASIVIRERIAKAPAAQRAVFEGVRRLLETITEESAEPLAELTAEYVNANKPPDGFFRSAARLLSDLTSNELATVRELLARMSVESVILDRDEVPFMFRELVDDKLRGGPKHIQYARPLPLNDARRPTTQSEWADLGEFSSAHEPHVFSVIRQMKLNGLADDPPQGGFIGVSGKENFVVSSDFLRRLRKLFTHE